MSEKEFTELIELHQNIVHKICIIYTDNEEDHNDLFQEIVFQAWRSISNFKGNSKFTTWLYRVGLYTALTEKRKKKIDLKEYLEESRFQNMSPEERGPVENLYKVIGKLSKSDKALVMLLLEEKTYAEIGEILGITENNVGVKINRVKKKMKDLWS